MRLQVDKNNEKVLVTLKGNLDESGACQVEHALDGLREVSRGNKVVVDLSGVHSFEYFGIASFTKVIRGQINYFDEITLTGLHGSIENVFKRFGFKNGSG